MGSDWQRWVVATATPLFRYRCWWSGVLAGLPATSGGRLDQHLLAVGARVRFSLKFIPNVAWIIASVLCKLTSINSNITCWTSINSNTTLAAALEEAALIGVHLTMSAGTAAVASLEEGAKVRAPLFRAGLRDMAYGFPAMIVFCVGLTESFVHA